MMCFTPVASGNILIHMSPELDLAKNIYLYRKTTKFQRLGTNFIAKVLVLHKYRYLT